MTAVMPERADVQRRHRRLPVAPLVALVEAHGGFTECAEQARYLPTLARAWERAKADGSLTWVAADVLAVKLLGLHPLLVWATSGRRRCATWTSGSSAPGSSISRCSRKGSSGPSTRLGGPLSHRGSCGYAPGGMTVSYPNSSTTEPFVPLRLAGFIGVYPHSPGEPAKVRVSFQLSRHLTESEKWLHRAQQEVNDASITGGELQTVCRPHEIETRREGIDEALGELELSGQDIDEAQRQAVRHAEAELHRIDFEQ